MKYRSDGSTRIMLVRYCLVWIFTYYYYYCCCCCCSIVRADTSNSSGMLETRVQNGYNANEREIPYVVSLQNVENSGHFCGGSILTATWVITAAHCTENDAITLLAEQIQVVTGTINSMPWSVHRVTRIRRHESYAKNDSAINDIALLKVTPPFVLDNGFVAPVRLPDPLLYIAKDTKAIVAGWGTTTYPKLTMPPRLQRLDVTIVSENYCKEAYMKELTNIYTVHLCTHEATGIPRGSCQGDSGGPLTIDNDILVGIVSWSHKNGTCGTFPSVYTRVSKFIFWILENVYYE